MSDDKIYVTIRGEVVTNPHRTLGVSESATQAEIVAAFKAAAKKYSPETHPDKFAEITVSYKFLTAPENRHALVLGPLSTPDPDSFFKTKNPKKTKSVKSVSSPKNTETEFGSDKVQRSLKEAFCYFLMDVGIDIDEFD